MSDVVELMAATACDRAHESPINQRPCRRHGCDRKLGTGQECRFFYESRAVLAALEEAGFMVVPAKATPLTGITHEQEGYIPDPTPTSL